MRKTANQTQGEDKNGTNTLDIVEKAMSIQELDVELLKCRVTTLEEVLKLVVGFIEDNEVHPEDSNPFYKLAKSVLPPGGE